MTITGGCLCGGVRFELSEPPMFATYCHCTRWQRRTGCGASAEARSVPGSVRVVAGADLVKAYEPLRGGWHELFCSNCGSALFSRDPDDPEQMSVSMGAFDGGRRRAAEQAPVHELRGGLGADPRRRAGALPGVRAGLAPRPA